MSKKKPKIKVWLSPFGDQFAVTDVKGMWVKKPGTHSLWSFNGRGQAGRTLARYGFDLQKDDAKPLQNAFRVFIKNLYEPSALKDAEKMNSFIRSKLKPESSSVSPSSPEFWVDAKGQHPSALTVISVQDVETGKYKPVDKSKLAEVVAYMKKLAKQ